MKKTKSSKKIVLKITMSMTALWLCWWLCCGCVNLVAVLILLWLC